MRSPVHWGIVEPCRTFTTSKWSSPPCIAEHTRSVGHQVCCILGDSPDSIGGRHCWTASPGGGL